MAARTTRPTSTHPVRPLELCHRLPTSVRRPALGRSSRRLGARRRAGSLHRDGAGQGHHGRARPRVDDGVEHVGQHVDDDEAGGEDQGHALDDGEVPFVDRGYEQAAEPGQHEYLLDDHRPAEQVAELDAGHRGDGDQRPQEEVLPGDHPLGQALAPGGAGVVEADHLEHGGPRRTHHGRPDPQAQGEGGEEDLLQVEPGVLGDAGKALRGREVVEHRRQEGHQAGADDEAGHAEPDDRHAPAHVVHQTGPA